MKDKEFLYVGFYIDTHNRTILKIGTTNDLVRRQKEHTTNYKKAKHYTMPPDSEFKYLWHLKLSKYNTLRYEDENREQWQIANIGHFIRNDRFFMEVIPPTVNIHIRKTYVVSLAPVLAELSAREHPPN